MFQLKEVVKLIDMDELVEGIWRCDCSSRQSIEEYIKAQPVVATLKAEYKVNLSPFYENYRMDKEGD